ncbi:MAG: multifunctional CCA tRNA nucleotidyl transferase/2'3'-cyclic phosphodiesterase/2'nucleotidase/phosphatase [Legionellaceae bacterium]|nr:multifunctional CCA tRNA nucleotidyl transferase/2'3'-cyclic phosphodiesterase/2'nucleotidase/phosphatase [Legionellaceae bacterium]
MKIYLVGGAVRDQLLGEPFHERDWVVVGGTPDELLKQGYQQVGRDFPVFLHPKSKEEYALARTERKAGDGYYGFVCDFNSSVTLEEDLSRRDLTINAMAMDDDGQVIDPYGGQRDLAAKQLKHVSPAFSEDPVRVLRVARFAARYFHLGFVVADKTCALIQKMAERGDLAHLVPERVWQEWHKSLYGQHPEIFIKVLHACDALIAVLPELHDGMDLKALVAASKISHDPVIRFAALVHGLREEKVEALCQRLRIPNEYQQLALLSTNYADQILALSHLSAEDSVTALERIDPFRRYARFDALLRVCEARTMAEGVDDMDDVEYIARWKQVFEVCQHINPRVLIEEGYQGEQIKHQLHERRVMAVHALINNWEK